MQASMTSLWLCFLLLCLFALQTEQVRNKLVNLPSYTGPALDMYTGYITVDQKNGRALFYWLIKAETDSANKPLLVWFQGGPGCSGLIGLFMENGPFRVVPGSTPGSSNVVYNNLGWTQFANVLFIEQPAFVGFSYSNTSSDKTTGDGKAAADNLQFLRQFVTTEFREFYGRDTWFTGESYGGVYVPTLTDLILGNASSVLYPQLKGFMIGNPVFSCQNGFIGSSGPYYIEQINLLYWHGFASYTNYFNWTVQGCNDPNKATQPNCQYIYNLAISQVGVINQEYLTMSRSTEKTQQQQNWPSLDPDDIYQNFCTGNGSIAFAETPLPNTAGTCASELGTVLAIYLNRADVQSALGTVPTTWSQCQSLNYNISGASMIPLYRNFFKNKPDFKILIYSGDVDILTVPFAFTQPCFAQLSTSTVSLWQPWFVNGATAGYVEVFDKYTYATIKGAGHEAPLYQPLTSYQMIYRFLTNGHLKEKQVSGGGHYYKKYLTQGDMLRMYGLAPKLN